MANDVTILPEGVAELELHIANGLFEAAQEVIARAHPPRLTGRLAASGHAAVYVNGALVHGEAAGGLDPSTGIEAFAYFTDYKARWIEFGTVKMAPRPYLGPAAMSVEGSISGIVGSAIGRV